MIAAREATPIARSSRLRPATAGHAELELLKWMALGSMVIDHVGKTVLPALVEVTHFAGRLALPAFALIVAKRLALEPSLRARYLHRLALFGLLAQPAFGLVAGWQQANILFTLGLGVAADLGLSCVRRRGPGKLGAILVPLALVLGSRCEFGPWGVALVPALASLERRRPRSGDWLAGPAALVANGWPPAALDTGALVATPLVLLLRDSPVVVPRLHRWFFYGFYPAHLYVLAALQRALA